MIPVQPGSINSSNTDISRQQDKDTDQTAKITSFRPLSLASDIDLKHGASPIDVQHARVMLMLTQDKGQTPLIRSALTKVIDADDQVSPLTQDQLRAVLETPITLKLILTPKQAKQYPDGVSRETDVLTLVDFFEAEHIEVTGSSARNILEGKPQLQSQDLDLVLNIDLSKFGKTPEERNQNILKTFAEHFEFPKDVADRCALPFINHSFGCTFKPTVDTENSRSIDITFIDNQKDKPKKADKKSGSATSQPAEVARWDNIQSSPRLLFYKDSSSKVTNILGVKALEFLQKNGLVLINPNIKSEGALLRAKKAVEKQKQFNDTPVRSLQYQLIPQFYKAADSYEKHQFQQSTGFKQDIPLISLHELLDIHQELEKAFQQGQLNEHDVKAVEICLAEAAYRYKPDDTAAQADQYFYKAHILNTVDKKEFVAKNLMKALEALKDPARLHPRSKALLTASLNAEALTIFTPAAALHALHFALYDKSDDILDTVMQSIDRYTSQLQGQNKKNAAQFKQDFKQLVINDPQQLRLLQLLSKHNPDDESFRNELIKAIVKNADTKPANAAEFLNQFDLKAIKQAQQTHQLIKMCMKPAIVKSLQPAFVQSLLSSSLKMTQSLEDSRPLKKLIIEAIKINSPLLEHMDNSNWQHFFEKMQQHEPTEKPSQAMYFAASKASLKDKPADALTLLVQGFNQTPLDYSLLNKVIELAVQIKQPQTGLAALINYCKNANDLQRMNPQLQDIFNNLLNSTTIPVTSEMTEQLKQLNFMVDAEKLTSPALKQAALNALDSYQAVLSDPKINLGQLALFKLSGELRQINDVVQPADSRQKMDQTIKRAAAYSFKLEADRRMLNANSTTQALNNQVNQMVYQKALDSFNELDEHTALDVTHIGEIHAMTGKYDLALNAFKDAMAIDSGYVSEQLGSVLTRIENTQILKEELAQLSKLMIMANIQKKPVALTLMLEMLVAVRNHPNTPSNERTALAHRILTQTLNSIFVENKKPDLITPVDQLSRQTDLQINALTYALQPSNDNRSIATTVKQGHAPYEFLKQMHTINAMLHIPEKTARLKKLVDTQGTLSKEDYGYLERFLSLNFSMSSNLVALDYKEILAVNVKRQLIEQQAEILNNTVFAAYALPETMMKTKDKSNAAVLESVFRTRQLSAMVNDTVANTENTGQLIDYLLNTIEKMRSYTTQLPKKPNFNDKLAALEKAFGKIAPQILGSEASLLMVLNVLTQGNKWDAEAFAALPQGITDKKLKEHRIVARELYKSNISNKDAENSPLLRHFVLQNKSFIAGSDSGKFALRYEKDLNLKIFTTILKNMNTKELAVFAAQQVKAASDKELPLVKEAASLLSKK